MGKRQNFLRSPLRLLTLRDIILSPVLIKGARATSGKIVILPSLRSRVVHSTARRTSNDIVLAIVRTARRTERAFIRRRHSSPPCETATRGRSPMKTPEAQRRSAALAVRPKRRVAAE